MSIQWTCKQADFIATSIVDIADLQTKINALTFSNTTLQYISTSDSKNTIYTFIFSNILVKADKQILNNFVATYNFIALTGNICLLKDSKTSGTSGGTFIQGIWNVRTLTTLSGLINFATLANNQITLTIPGSYRMLIKAPACNVQGHQVRLNNITDNVMQYGTNAYSTTASALSSTQVINSSVSELTYIFTIIKTTILQVEHMCTLTVPGFGFGKSNNFSTEEIYTTVSVEILSRT